ncbi:hypothetical protein H5410_060703 [Solanum commersonii]|uniref:Uncharacterized protein n=1 Tax=Solanum commersonii TaxID=4109 RepID=A0A9J5W671_SOLCO|nr:hypothetical protein H5410_060703 [Solanum commersonii]
MSNQDQFSGTSKNTFRTSTLSKDWQYLWTSIKNIVYDTHSMFPVINKWLEFSVNKKVEDLRLNMHYRDVYPTGHDQPYSLPEVLFNSSSIIKLKCNNWRI